MALGKYTTNCTSTMGISMKQNRRNKQMIFEWIRDEIQLAYQFGISVQVDGVYYAPKDFRDLYHVVEDANYMKDFIDDGKGKIVQINFDKVKLK